MDLGEQPRYQLEAIAELGRRRYAVEAHEPTECHVDKVGEINGTRDERVIRVLAARRHLERKARVPAVRGQPLRPRPPVLF
ncbi:MAG TPA: hypothetical protein VK719_00435, partial [Trebonia sp.]|nr:hypothetical protein [Trebonia sp.]